jgi:hypothetical protein
MSELQAIADRVEIEALRGEFTDAVMMDDHDRLTSPQGNNNLGDPAPDHRKSGHRAGRPVACPGRTRVPCGTVTP